MINKSYH